MISDIRLQQFRSYGDESFEFGEGVNIIVGPNGSGKTNLLEAILVLARGSSYRVPDIELVSFEADWFRLDAHIEPIDVLRTIKFKSVPRPTKTYEIQEKVFQRLSVQHTIPAVLFEPNHLFLLHGSPDARRNYLDDMLEQLLPGFAQHRRNYRRLLSQRNALLKRSQQPSAQEFFPWNLRLSELGAYITRSRSDLCEQLNASFQSIYEEIAQADTKVSIAYLPKFELESYESLLFSKLESSIQDDARRGFTAYGPHREDFAVYFNDHIADETASRGETRTALLALKIIEMQLLEQISGQTPLLLLDDVFSELDGSRRRSLTSYLQRYQTFLTTTDADVVIKHFTDSTILPLSKNQ